MPYTLFVLNKDRKGKLKAYGENHATMASAEKHRQNLRDYYKRFAEDKHGLVATRIAKSDLFPKRMTSKEIMRRVFGK